MTIKLIISEVDGVLTRDTFRVDELGHVLYKEYNINDLEIINKIKNSIPVVFLSSDNHISYHFFRRKNIPFYWAKKDKVSVLRTILQRYSVTPDEVVYIAGKISDLGCVRMIPTAFCPINLSSFFNKYTTTLHVNPGEGVFVYFYLNFFNKYN